MDNQLSVVFANGDVLTYSTAIKMGNPSISVNMSYVSSEKKSVDFITELTESILGEEFKGKLTDKVKDELNSAIENDSSADLEFTAEDCTAEVDFRQIGNIFNLYVECVSVK